MSVRFAPNALLSVAIATSLLLAALMLGIAMDQRWMGIELRVESTLVTGDVAIDGLWIERVVPASPAAGLPEFAVLTAITGLDGTNIRLTPADLLDEPDSLSTYAEMRTFFSRQMAIAQLLSQPRVQLEVQPLYGAGEATAVSPQRRRPFWTLPLAFWLQIGVGLVGFWTGTWIWALRTREWATRMLALAGAGLMISAFPAAVYSTRELAIDGDLFTLLSHMNHAGALSFGIGVIGLFLVYPKRLVEPRWLAVPVLIFAAWQVFDILQLADGPAIGFHLGVVLAMSAILVLVGVQFVLTRGDALARAALTWLGLAVAVGAGAFVFTVIAPNLLGLPAVVSQGEAFVFFLLIYVGVALGVARYRLFELDEWAFRILFYVIGVLLILVLDAILIVTIVDERAPAFALSLLIVALAWLPLRDTLARLVLHRAERNQHGQFRKVMDVALAASGTDQRARWRALLQDVFNPLSMEDMVRLDGPALMDDGLALDVPGPGALPNYRLHHAWGGRRLFSPRDAELAGELCAMLGNALESRAAYELGVTEERERIARDIHDNIGVQLMGALHSRDAGRKDLMIRETLTDLRDIINNASQPDLSLEEMLADLRIQISEHLFAAGISMDWKVESGEREQLPLATAHALRSIVREAVQNALKHSGARRIAIALRHKAGILTIVVDDDGKGFDADTAKNGNGLANMRARATSLGGGFNIASDSAGTRIEAHLPVQSVRLTP